MLIAACNDSSNAGNQDFSIPLRYIPEGYIGLERKEYIKGLLGYSVTCVTARACLC
jgi:hypothetical protein